MLTIQEKPLILVYFNFRGKLQSIRHLAIYLGLSYIEVHLEDKQQQKKMLPQQVCNALKDIKIERQLLPLLVHEGHYIYDLYPIMGYICRRFNRKQLLGRNIQQKARLQEILQIFFNRQPISMAQLFRLADDCYGKSPLYIQHQKRASFQKLMNESCYLKEIALYLEQSNKKSIFIFGEITLIDFLYMESCHYILGNFNDLVPKTKNVISTRGDLQEDTNIKHLQTMRTFKANIQGQQYYIKNRVTLEQKSIIFYAFPPQRVVGIRSIWVGDSWYVR